MPAFVLCVSLLAATVPQPVSYQEAYSAAQSTRKPMLILVGADWCPACRVMKYTTLPALQRAGRLNDVSFTIVDVDSDRRLGTELMRSSSIPQLVLCLPVGKTWKRYYLHGNQSPDRILAMVRGGLEEQQLAAAAATPPSTPVPTPVPSEPDMTADE